MRGFTLVELLVLITIVAILAALLLTGVSAIIVRAKSATCSGHLRQMMTAFTMYAQENGRYPNMGLAPVGPASELWNAVISPYLNDGNTNLTAGYTYMRCPLEPDKSMRTYGVNYTYDLNPPVITYPHIFGGSTSPLKISSKTLLMADAFGLTIYNRTRWPFDNASGDGNAALTGSGYPHNGGAFKRHKGRINAGFADGSIRVMSTSDWRSETNIWGY